MQSATNVHREANAPFFLYFAWPFCCIAKKICSEDMICESDHLIDHNRVKCFCWPSRKEKTQSPRHGAHLIQSIPSPVFFRRLFRQERQDCPADTLQLQRARGPVSPSHAREFLHAAATALPPRRNRYRSGGAPRPAGASREGSVRHTAPCFRRLQSFRRTR